VMTNRSDRESAKPRGSQRFERDDVIREPACGPHQGQQQDGAARTGRTHGCTRLVLIAKQKLLQDGTPRLRLAHSQSDYTARALTARLALSTYRLRLHVS